MTEIDKKRKEIIEEYKLSFSKLLELPKFTDEETKQSLQRINSDLINFIRSCETFYCLNKSVYGESSKCLEQCLDCRKK